MASASISFKDMFIRVSTISVTAFLERSIATLQAVGSLCVLQVDPVCGGARGCSALLLINRTPFLKIYKMANRACNNRARHAVCKDGCLLISSGVGFPYRKIFIMSRKYHDIFLKF